jgi:putative nucleotidyltransferase with HDIG domain
MRQATRRSVVSSTNPGTLIEAQYESMVRHMERTRDLAEMVAVWLGLGPDRIQVVRYAAVLHDIGKSRIPYSILDKPGGLIEFEWIIVRRHPEMGAKILSRIVGFERVCAAVAAHHERFDGQGYPAGLVGLDIPLEARLISVADAYDAMTNERPYRRALSHDRAMEQLDRGAGRQFDPMVVEATKALLGGTGVTAQQWHAAHPQRAWHASP